MTASAQQRALAYAAAGSGEVFPVNTCLMQVRRAYGIAAKYPTAYAAWIGAGGHDGAYTHYQIPAPAGAPIFFKGHSPAGHIAIAAGGGKCWSTDIKRRGRWALVPIAYVCDKWNMSYLGWSETLNGVRVVPRVTA